MRGKAEDEKNAEIIVLEERRSDTLNLAADDARLVGFVVRVGEEARWVVDDLLEGEARVGARVGAVVEDASGERSLDAVTAAADAVGLRLGVVKGDSWWAVGASGSLVDVRGRLGRRKVAAAVLKVCGVEEVDAIADRVLLDV